MTTTTTYIPAAIDSFILEEQEAGTIEEELCEECGDGVDYCSESGTCSLFDYEY